MIWDRTQLVSLKRGGFTEVTIHGEIVVHDGQKVVFQTRDCLGKYPMRSLLKPFQFLATGIKKELAESLKYTPCLGSVSATESQIEQIQNWYSDSSSKKRITQLKLLPCYPSDETGRAIAKSKNTPPSAFNHQCFSKHMAILETCDREGWDTSTYNQVSHPYHKKLIEQLSQLLQFDSKETPWVVDGCKLPSPVLTLSEMALLYQKLGAAAPGSELSHLKQKMVRNPEWIGGPERIDTLLMQRNPGLVAKEGADGLLGLAVPPSSKFPEGLGIVIKTWAGYQPKHAAIALVPLLKVLGLNSVEDISPDHTVEFHYEPFKENSVRVWDISPELSEKIAVWPGDVTFKRTVSYDTTQGNHMTLSSIESTLHVGAHTDGINHFKKTTLGIESHSLEPYHGVCQVVSIKKDRGALIDKKDFEGKKILSSRILVRTDSFPDPNHFNEDYVSFSSSAIQYLAEQGVCLVGIDTPSIDPFSSKDLPAHQATLKAQLNILEGIVLTGVDDGIYYLSAVPLKIKGADASPVRAFLMPVQ